MEFIIGVLFGILLWLTPLAVVLYVAYLIVRIPLRRRERVRGFLTLVDVGLADGRRVEDTIISVAETRDPGLGRGFAMLAACLRTGKLRFSEALAAVPRYLPSEVIAMLKAGERIGDLRAVMPACRQLTKDNFGQNRSSLNYILIVAFLTTPAAIFILAMLQTLVLPKLIDISENIDSGVPSGLQFLRAFSGPLLFVQLVLLLVVWVTAFVYIGGSAESLWFGKRVSSLLDRLCYRIPWRRKRMQRDFCAMLAVLLDANVPEPEALTLAAECTGNDVFRRRAAQAVAEMARGVKLTEAINAIDDTGEFHWRLANAVHARNSFSKAIAGWSNVLEAKAFQEQQATAQVITTGLVLINGVFVGTIVVSVFSFLTTLINGATLW